MDKELAIFELPKKEEKAQIELVDKMLFDTKFPVKEVRKASDKSTGQKDTGGVRGNIFSGGKKANEFDTAIKRAIAKITEDKDSEEPFEISSGNSQTYVSNLVVIANQWLSQLRQAREDKKKEIRGVKEEIKNTSNKTKVKKAS